MTVLSLSAKLHLAAVQVWPQVPVDPGRHPADPVRDRGRHPHRCGHRIIRYGFKGCALGPVVGLVVGLGVGAAFQHSIGKRHSVAMTTGWPSINMLLLHGSGQLLSPYVAGANVFTCERGCTSTLPPSLVVTTGSKPVGRTAFGRTA